MRDLLWQPWLQSSLYCFASNAGIWLSPQRQREAGRIRQLCSIKCSSDNVHQPARRHYYVSRKTEELCLKRFSNLTSTNCGGVINLEHADKYQLKGQTAVFNRQILTRLNSRVSDFDSCTTNCQAGSKTPPIKIGSTDYV
jgi:hypothetical protein